MAPARPPAEQLLEDVGQYVRRKEQARVELGLQADARVRVYVSDRGLCPVGIDVELRPRQAAQIVAASAPPPGTSAPVAEGIDAEVHLTYATLHLLLEGELAPHVAMMAGDITARGDMRALLRFGVLFG